MSADEARLFEIVVIRDSADARALELVGAEGVLLGVSEDEATRDRWYVVQVGELPAVMLESKHLDRTGRSVSRESVYPGDRFRVTRAGDIVGDPETVANEIGGRELRRPRREERA